MKFNEFDPTNQKLKKIKAEISVKLKSFLIKKIYEVIKIDGLIHSMINSNFEITHDIKGETLNSFFDPLFLYYDDFSSINNDILNAEGVPYLGYVQVLLKGLNFPSKIHDYHTSDTFLFKQNENIIFLFFNLNDSHPSEGSIVITIFENNTFKIKEFQFILGDKLLSDEIGMFNTISDNFEDKDKFVEDYISNIKIKVEENNGKRLYLRESFNKSIINSQIIYEEIKDLCETNKEESLFNYKILTEAWWNIYEDETTE